ncbi:hypothetical protein [Fortiea contorta]|uniref:hypothetical protein n=1 Tax=Fortiea contorta TaxID=1892405 RepID=UPI00034C7D38|nr:hypothetical protein [Fortiea contorta]
MAVEKLSVAQANLKMTLWNSEAEAIKSSEFYDYLQDMGLPEEIVTRLHELISRTLKIGKKFFAIGKIVLFKIIEFVKAHPFLVAGAGICAVVGLAIYNLIISIPFLGPFLEPIARALGIGITLTGAIVGHELDKRFPGVGQNIVEIVSEFFQLFAEVINALSHELAFI